MERTIKQKLLGQYFSGGRIADALYGLLGEPIGKSVIDPMCGQADLLLPFKEKNRIIGIELDKEAYYNAVQLTSNDNIISGNAFDENILGSLTLDGYDVVVTNPPFIRRENYKKATELIEGSLPTKQICHNLANLVKRVNTLNSQQKDKISAYINSASGLTDIAYFSLILCFVITKIGGNIALVVPSALLGREYSVPFIELLRDLFEIQYVVNDVNSVWFKGIAQVKTSLIVAKRTDSSTAQNHIVVLDVFKRSLSENSIFSFLENGQSIIEFIETQQEIPHKCEMQIIPQNDFANKLGIDATSKLKPFCTKNCHFTNIESLGISCGQGFRSGANACFIFERVGQQYISKIGSLDIEPVKDYFLPLIQSQKVLDKNYSVCSDRYLAALLFVPKRYARTLDIGTINNSIQQSYISLPQALDDYLSKSELYEIKGTPVPKLSAVRTNAKHDSNEVRFWYNLPDFTPRHQGAVFVPRVNGSHIVARANFNNYIVDANFITFWNCNEDAPSEWILALLNSSWFSILCEETGIVLGGGALKLDAIQLKKIPIPVLEEKDIQDLNALGIKLASLSSDASEPIISRIDKIIFGKIGTNDQATLQKVQRIKKEYIERRL